MKEKEIVQIRERVMPSGKTSLYLAYRVNGKRCYEYPKLYLLPEKGTGKTQAVAANRETMRLIKAMQAKKMLELTQNRSGIVVKKEPSRVLLTEWIETFREYKERTTRGKEYVNTVINVERHLLIYAGNKATMADIDKKWCQGFIDYLRKAKGKYKDKPLSDLTRKVYYTAFNSMLKKAVRDGVLPSNPMDAIDPGDKLPGAESERVYLDISEVRRIAKTETAHPLSKQAFMFSCFTGLRISDIRQLKWDDIERLEDEDGTVRYRIRKKMQKTQKNIILPLSGEAVSWLPERKGERVFEGLVCSPNLIANVRRLAKDAGITKDVCFHTARHTFATMMLTLGADIYTTSKLLGHSRIATTEIYAKIVDKKKDEAVDLIDKYFGK